MKFTCETVEKRGRDGAPLMRGVEWTESTIWEFLADMAARGACTVGGGGSVIMLLPLLGGDRRAVVYVVVMLAILVAGIFGLGASYHEVPGRPRALLFHADGAIEAPRGLADHRNSSFRLRPKLAEIGNVESIQLEATTPGVIDYTHGVRLITKDGAVIYVARNLEPDQALTLAKRLTNAIVQFRFDLGEALKHDGRQMELVID